MTSGHVFIGHTQLRFIGRSMCTRRHPRAPWRRRGSTNDQLKELIAYIERLLPPDEGDT